MKRFFDILISTCALIALMPVFIIIALLVSRNLGSPVFFCQMRPGLNGFPFKMIKFRTMRDSMGLNGALLPDSQRLTPFGRFLRGSSLDELPELWNVLKGEMSLVGPRPLLLEYLPLYSHDQARRHEVRPGITGWAQVNGRDELSIPEKVTWDMQYLQRQSLWFDIQILWLTFLKVARKDGVSH